MDTVKVQNFLRENPSAEFPRFTPITSAECAQLRRGIAKRLGLNAECEPLDILNTLRSTAVFIDGVDGEDAFNLRNLISRLGIKTRADVLVNWHRFESLDLIALSDLNEHFEDIWYPGSDNIEIFDESLGWFVLVRHDGQSVPLTSALTGRVDSWRNIAVSPAAFLNTPPCPPLQSTLYPLPSALPPLPAPAPESCAARFSTLRAKPRRKPD
jgi:hypothetical protein